MPVMTGQLEETATGLSYFLPSFLMKTVTA